ncbi:hypothetical protein [Streptomyces showdoensis]|uniref:hypothetical protein n=1 Tax=Streptomyces showdoensis TaxID=68268 RepID=UPI00103AAFC7|nr:hypothetical protein [Streptomyces showdoensis]
MSDSRTPYAHALHTINETSTRLNLITEGRGVSGEVAASVLTAHSNLAIASALLAVADALRGASPVRSPEVAPWPL